MHYQKSEYPLDYTKTEIPQTAASTSSGLDGLAVDAQATEEAKVATDEVAEQIKDLTDKALGMLSGLMPTVERSLKEQPLATLVLVSAAAFMLGAVWKK